MSSIERGESYIISYNEVNKMFLFSGFIVDFTKYIINNSDYKKLEKSNRDLVESINSLIGKSILDYNQVNDNIPDQVVVLAIEEQEVLVDLIVGELDLVSGSVLEGDDIEHLKKAVRYYHQACCFILTGNSCFKNALKYLEDEGEYVSGFSFNEEEALNFAEFFRDVSEWLVSDCLSDIFNKFIFKNGVGAYFPDIVLDKVITDVLKGELKLSSYWNRNVLIAVLNSALVEDDRMETESGEFLNLLMHLANTVSAPRRMKKLILGCLYKSHHDSIKMACCNYMELWPINYSEDSSENVRQFYWLFSNFFEWWEKDCNVEVKKDIVNDASKISPDILRNVIGCTESYVRFDFPFLRDDGVFEIDMSIYNDYCDIFNYASDTRFIVVFIRELVALGQMRFIPNKDSLSNGLGIGKPLGKNPIRCLLRKED